MRVAAHFSFPGDAMNPGAAGAVAPGKEIPREYIFEPPPPGSTPVDRSLVSTLPPPVPVSKQASTPAQANPPAQANLSEKENLKAFLNGVYENENSDLKSEHYALLL